MLLPWFILSLQANFIFFHFDIIKFYRDSSCHILGSRLMQVVLEMFLEGLLDKVVLNIL
uniref:Nucleic acid binding protein n=1 Tax=Rhizophora mucronata TaxID=61149 RepID=A0A2P2J508_RHIMU